MLRNIVKSPIWNSKKITNIIMQITLQKFIWQTKIWIGETGIPRSIEQNLDIRKCYWTKIHCFRKNKSKLQRKWKIMWLDPPNNKSVKKSGARVEKHSLREHKLYVFFKQKYIESKFINSHNRKVTHWEKEKHTMALLPQ